MYYEQLISNNIHSILKKHQMPIIIINIIKCLTEKEYQKMQKEKLQNNQVYFRLFMKTLR